MIKAMMLVTALLSTPQNLWADITDSGNLSIGGQGVIAGTMTVKGNAFSVGGSTFVVAAGSITLGGRLNASAAGIKWADGTTTVTGASSVSIATYTINIPERTGFNTTFNGCNIAGSTITATISGTKVIVQFNGAMKSTQNAETIGLIALMDGQPATGYTAQQSNCITQAFLTYSPHIMSCNWLFTGVSAGSHSFCIGAREGTSAGTWTAPITGTSGDGTYGNSLIIYQF